MPSPFFLKAFDLIKSQEIAGRETRPLQFNQTACVLRMAEVKTQIPYTAEP